MVEPNLFEIKIADECQITQLRPTPWFKSLSRDQQITKLRSYLVELQKEHEKAASVTEKARISSLMGAVHDYLTEINS